MKNEFEGKYEMGCFLELEGGLNNNLVYSLTVRWSLLNFLFVTPTLTRHFNHSDSSIWIGGLNTFMI